jgi:succinate dehydrogenase flavin-adding protein (antitoxin of CptAB toxin-antitoxin module)
MGDLEKRELGLLLEQQDPDLLDWFLGRTKPKNTSISSAIENILIFHHKRRNSRELISGDSLECLEYEL